MNVYVTAEDIRQADFRYKWGGGPIRKELINLEWNDLDLLAAGLRIKSETVVGVTVQLSPEEEEFSLPQRPCLNHARFEECEDWCSREDYVTWAKAGFLAKVVF